MREGATDYIVKPFDAQALIEMARRQLALRVVPNELVAVAPEANRLVALARKIAENDAMVLIIVDSVTGKEVYARFIRDHSGRATAPYVAINCAAIPQNTLAASASSCSMVVRVTRATGPISCSGPRGSLAAASFTRRTWIRGSLRASPRESPRPAGNRTSRQVSTPGRRFGLKRPVWITTLR